MSAPSSGPLPAGREGGATTRRRVRATDSKHRLFEASMILIGDRGHHRVTVDEIAAAAGVSKGTVYYNFGSKAQLIGQLMRFGADVLFERLEKGTADPDPAAGFRDMVAASLEFMDEYPSFAQLWISEQWQSPSDWAETLAALGSEIIGVIREALDRLDATGNYPGLGATDRAAMATAVFGAVLIIGRDRHVFHPERSIATCVQAVSAFTGLG
ncbi:MULTISPECIES: TetR/AcrR family transcriptional regulator [Micrococcaceae]|uniref:Transcriptional regulator, TetR family n=1 Tax=Arthrobacter rhombi TaxID=71253 RepID=A0A1R4F8Q4_9MICC|nr:MULTISPECIES: TetR/AcrR family transcriptional regulator [Micrococcaceae]PCC24002.1 TetR/AcrR family transcriptional regulator [Glutamicibacter sp. BW78]SJM52264.1 Transcriptional regulator, TetR family [Arthrobacter rhombi]